MRSTDKGMDGASTEHNEINADMRISAKGRKQKGKKISGLLA